jgi:alkylation response protein AidB-like acyl-CoA dehydrogenase
MNFDWTSEDLDFKNRIAALFDSESLTVLETLERAELPELKATTGTFLRRLAETGYLALGVGPEAAAETLHLMAGQEEVARISGSLFLAVETTARLFGGLLKGFGEPDRVRDILEPLLRGEIIASVAVSEPAGNEPRASRTLAREDGDSFVLNGRKSFATNGPIADYIAVTGEVDGLLAVFLVEPQMAGVSVGPRLQTLGYNGIAVSSIDLTAVRVPRSRVLGPFRDAKPLEWLRQIDNLVLSVASVGLMYRTLREAKEHASGHVRAGKAVGAHQEVRFKLAEMLTLAQTAQLLAYRTAWLHATAAAEAATLIHCAKVFSAEASERVASLAMQIAAGEAYLSGNLLERGYRDAKYAAIAGTTSELARMAIAQDLLNLYRV